MTIKNAIQSFMWAMLALCFTAKSVLAQSTTPSLSFRISPEKPAYYPGEPVLFSVFVKNNGPEKVALSFGHSHVTAFEFKIFKTEAPNRLLGMGERIEREGLSSELPFEINPGSEDKLDLILNRWISTQRSPGNYTVECQILGHEIFPPVVEGQVGEIIFPPKAVVRFNFRILEKNEIATSKMIQEFFDATKRNETEADRKAAQVARQKLIFAESPDTLDFKRDVLLNDKIDYWDRQAALIAIKRMNDPKAFEILKDLSQHPKTLGVMDLDVEAAFKERQSSK